MKRFIKNAVLFSVLYLNGLPATDIELRNYPNPFNPVTSIVFYLSIKSDVMITVFNSVGEKVKELVQRNMPAGKHNVIFDGSGLNSGIYYYAINNGIHYRRGSMLLIK